MELKELSRYEMATVKNTAKSVKRAVDKRNKLSAKIEELSLELVSVLDMIAEFEAPIIRLTGGYTSEQVLNGTRDRDKGVAAKAMTIGILPADIMDPREGVLVYGVECGTELAEELPETNFDDCIAGTPFGEDSVESSWAAEDSTATLL